MLGIKNITPLETHAPTPPWEEEPNIIIHSHITNIESKSKYLDLELKELTCTYLNKLSWRRVDKSLHRRVS